jgi:multidrug resistance efflux pump
MLVDWGVSIRRACKALKFDTSTYHYKSRRRAGQAGLEQRIREICETRVRYGYRRVHVLLRREGWLINMKRTRRIYNELGLQLRNKHPKRRVKLLVTEGEVVAALVRYQPGPDGEQVDIAVASADLAAAEAAVEQARSDLDRARVLAPREGTIIEVAARAGERPPASGLLQMGDTARMEAELEVFQTMAPRVAVGQKVSLVSGVLGAEPLTGSVARIGTLVGRQSVTADDPAANTDARVLLVTVALDDASSVRAARYVNLEVVARISVADSKAAEGPEQ